MKIMFLSLVITVTISGLIKIISSYFNKQQQQQKKEHLSQANIMSTEVSYKLYETVANRASVKNTTVRTQGDFFDFVLPTINQSQKNHIENRLSITNCGDNNE